MRARDVRKEYRQEIGDFVEISPRDARIREVEEKHEAARAIKAEEILVGMCEWYLAGKVTTSPNPTHLNTTHHPTPTAPHTVRPAEVRERAPQRKRFRQTHRLPLGHGARDVHFHHDARGVPVPEPPRRPRGGEQLPLDVLTTGGGERRRGREASTQREEPGVQEGEETGHRDGSSRGEQAATSRVPKHSVPLPCMRLAGPSHSGGARCIGVSRRRVFVPGVCGVLPAGPVCVHTTAAGTCGDTAAHVGRTPTRHSARRNAHVARTKRYPPGPSPHSDVTGLLVKPSPRPTPVPGPMPPLYDG